MGEKSSSENELKKLKENCDKFVDFGHQVQKTKVSVVDN